MDATEVNRNLSFTNVDKEEFSRGVLNDEMLALSMGYVKHWFRGTEYIINELIKLCLNIANNLYQFSIWIYFFPSNDVFVVALF